MKRKSPKSILRAAARLVRKGWTTQHLATTAAGRDAEWFTKGAANFSSWGALMRASGHIDATDLPEFNEAVHCLLRHLRTPQPPDTERAGAAQDAIWRWDRKIGMTGRKMAAAMFGAAARL